MRRLLIKIVIVVVGFSGLVAWNKFDRSANYEKTAAEVTRIDEVCYLKKVERGIGSKTTSTTKPAPRGLAALWLLRSLG